MNTIVFPQTHRIIDCHAHIACLDFFPQPFMNGIIDNILSALAARGTSITRRQAEHLYFSRFQDSNCEQLIREMNDAGISQSVLLIADFTYALRESTLTIAEIIHKHLTVAKLYPNRFLVFPGIDPRWGQDGLNLFESTVQSHQAHGFKLYPPCGFTASDKRLYPFYEICSEFGLPVLLHVGATSPTFGFETSHPLQLDTAARDFPKVNFILAHGSVHYPDECIMLCTHRPNVFLDVSGYSVAPLSRLRHVFSAGIGHKILFGTDWPFFRLRGTQKDFVDLVLKSRNVFPRCMSVDEITNFFSGNLLRLLPEYSMPTAFADHDVAHGSFPTSPAPPQLT